MEEKITVVMVQPQKEPQVVELNNKYRDLSEAVGGTMQVIYPYPDKVGLLMNDDGKLLGMQPNRALKDENGNIYDIIAGTFYVVGIWEDEFCSLTDQQIENYLSEFEQPYLYVRMGQGVLEVPIHKILPNDKRKTEEVMKKGQVLDFGAL